MSRRNIYFIPQTVTIDPDAQLWFTANSITNPTEIAAFNAFFVGTKVDGAYDKLYQGLPLCLNDATKNTVDMTLQVNSTNNGSITHSGGYVQGDGVSGYIDSNLNCLNDLPQDDVGVTFFCNTNAGSAVIDAGAYENFVTYFWMQIRDGFDTITLNLNDDAGGVAMSANAVGIGIYTFVRENSTTKKIYKNGILLATLTRISIPAPNLTLNLMRLNPLAVYSPKQYNMWFVHEGFDATEVANFHSRISTLKSDLGI